jgi:hypothetical protein
MLNRFSRVCWRAVGTALFEPLTLIGDLETRTEGRVGKTHFNVTPSEARGLAARAAADNSLEIPRPKGSE